MTTGTGGETTEPRPKANGGTDETKVTTGTRTTIPTGTDRNAGPRGSAPRPA